MDLEEWRTAQGWEGIYEVSSLGRIRSLPRKFCRNLRIIKSALNAKGYPQFVACRNGAYFSIRVHRLVALAFIPNHENKPQVNHIDGNRANNCVGNLEWVTNGENQIHAYEVLGRKKRGNKLTDEAVKWIRERYALGGITQKHLGLMFGVDDSSICTAISRKYHRNVP